ncbi:23S rRNA (pseudouridine(1915)-N(3))-methyltransferase RlmH [Candidatus Omnitrophota bacterium]
MNIKIISLDRAKDHEIKKLEARFVERLSKQCRVEFIDLKRPADYASANHTTILTQEAESVLKKVKDTDYCVLLDAQGKEMDSLQLSKQLSAWQHQGVNAIVFVIGGPLGVSEVLRNKADFILSLSRLTFTHEMARMLLCEALYRSFDILHGGNYHK